MITGLIAACLGILYIKMSFDVIKLRRSLKISYGVGENNEIIGPVSAHSNFSAYAPLLLILLYLVEQVSFMPKLLVFIIGFMFLLGRTLHYRGVSGKKTNFKLRVRGMMLTFMPMVMMIIILISNFIKEFFNL